MPLEINIETSSAHEADRAALRGERDRRLTECDWAMLADVPPGTSERFVGYRQALRDIMEDLTLTLESVVWPPYP